MSKTATTFLGALLLTCLAATSALATVYPPGPGGACPDSVTPRQIQDIAAACHPASGDTLLGLGGIITGMDTRGTTYGFYVQWSATGSPNTWTGQQVYTQGVPTNTAPFNFQRGDSVVVEYGFLQYYSNGTELTTYTPASNCLIRKVSSGNPLPPFKVGTANYFSRVATNPNAAQWAGCLVRVPGPLRVARNTLYNSQFLVVDNVACPEGSVGPCDSVFIETTTLCNPIFGKPALGTIIQSVQGVWEIFASDWEIKIRDANDVEAALPPAVSDAYPVADDTIRVVFDRQVTQASAENIANYSLSSYGEIVSATLEASGTAVMVAINNGLGHGATVKETITISGVVSASSGLPQASGESRTFFNGVVPLSMIQAPDPAGLLANPCLDRSAFAGAGSATGSRIAYRGVCVAAYPTSNLYYIQDATASTRAGVASYGPLTPMIVGHQYLFVSNMQEYYEETEGYGCVYMRDEGAVSMPALPVQTVAVLRDSTCDASQTITNGEEYEGMLVKLHNVKVVNCSSCDPGFGFDVAGPNPTFGDTIHITNKASAMYTFTPDSLMLVDVTGALSFSFGEFVVLPRSNADIVVLGQLNVPPTSASGVAFSAYPNPARVTKVSFTLPKQADVDLSVYDLSGRRVATLARGSMNAGQYVRDWDGGGAGAGVYFVRLRVGSENYNLRAISLK
jgi:hypothetical protein